MTVLRTERLVLRPLSRADAPVIAKLIGDPRVARMLVDIPQPFDTRAARKWLTRRWGEQRFAIEHDGQLIGGTAVCHYPRRAAELGYWLGHDHWGKGFGREAARAMVAFGFGPLGLEHLRSGHFTDNPASGRILRELGFVPINQGQVACAARGCQVDTVLYELSRQQAGYPPIAPNWTRWLGGIPGRLAWG